MIDKLSLAKARGELAALEADAAWQLFLAGRAEQRRIEAAVVAGLSTDRAPVIARWASAD
jgi:hypothetical protein